MTSILLVLVGIFSVAHGWTPAGAASGRPLVKLGGIARREFLGGAGNSAAAAAAAAAALGALTVGPAAAPAASGDADVALIAATAAELRAAARDPSRLEAALVAADGSLTLPRQVIGGGWWLRRLRRWWCWWWWGDVVVRGWVPERGLCPGQRLRRCKVLLSRGRMRGPDCEPPPRPRPPLRMGVLRGRSRCGRSRQRRRGRGISPGRRGNSSPKTSSG